MWRKLLWLCVCLFLSTTTAFAKDDRPIVYGARYYSPPDSHITTYFHIYRINTDGTRRTQLTFGHNDDFLPVWSPNRRRILFLRDGDPAVLNLATGAVRGIHIRGWEGLDVDTYLPGDLRWMGDRTIIASQGGPGFTAICSADTGKTLRTSMTDMSVPSRDGRLLFEQTFSKTSYIHGGRVRRLGNHRRLDGDRTADRVLQMPQGNVEWSDDGTLIGYDDSRAVLLVDSLRGPGRQVALKHDGLSPGAMVDFVGGADIVAAQGGSAYLAEYVGNSTVHPAYRFYAASTSSGEVSVVTDNKQSLALSPNGRRFCTAPARWTNFYERRPYRTYEDGSPAPSERDVWTAPLQIGDLKTGRIRTISKGLVWVIGADWK